ncbi:hypothetical protein [Pseudarthrobacter enclensis]|uniref:hypothetical protein n=1 Tax=Pseudarthrobacter enclensis TaxID=993070 RepID=UPI001146AD03|nr:hypothetical protein [Pseudarthrobacter enclensis]
MTPSVSLPAGPAAPSAADSAENSADWHKKQKQVWYRVSQAQKGVIPMSGKSPRGGANKKAGKSILEKRAEKKAKHGNSELNFIKPRKNQR